MTNPTDPTASATLSKFWENFKPQITGGLAGAGLGAATLGGAAAMSGEQDPEEQASNLKRNLLLGAVLGGAGGVGLGSAYQKYNTPAPRPGVLMDQLGRSLGSRVIGGTGVGIGSNAIASQLANKGLSIFGKPILGNGGAQGGKSLGELQEKLQSLLNEQTTVPKGATTANITTTGGQNAVRSLIDKLTANQGFLGQASQNPILRRLGLNVASGESHVADALRSLRGGTYRGTSGAVTGEEIIKKLLERRASPGTTAFPFIQEDVLGSGNPGAAIRASRFKSLLGRGVAGGLIGAGAGKLSDMSKPSY